LTKPRGSYTTISIMKKIAILALASAALLLSCREDETPTEVDYLRLLEDAVMRMEAADPQAQGFSLLVNANFYLLHGEDTGDEETWVRWATPQLSLGEPVLIAEAAREMTFHGGPPDHGRRFSFVGIHRQTGPAGFAFPHQVAAGRLAVVIEERATLFTGPNMVNMTATILSRGTVVVYDPDSAVGDFVQVRGFDYGRGSFVLASASYVRADTLSGIDTDVQSAILLRTALQAPAAQAELRNFLLEAALIEHPYSVFHADIFEARHPTAGVEMIEEDYVLETIPAEAAFIEADEYEGENGYLPTPE